MTIRRRTIGDATPRVVRRVGAMGGERPATRSREALCRAEQALRLREHELATVKAELQAVRADLADRERQRAGLMAHEARYKRDLRTLTEELQALRGSLRYRIGGLLIAPASAAARRVGQPLAAAARTVGRQRGTRSAETLDVMLETASNWFNELGEIASAYALLSAVGVSAHPSGKHRRLINQVVGAHALMNDAIVPPPRQPDPLYLSERGTALYCVHNALPYQSNGYSTRTQGVLTAAGLVGWDVVAVCRPGYPWDLPAKSISKPGEVRTTHLIDGARYVFVPGPNLHQQRLDHYILEAADGFVREAIAHRAALVHAASNHITGLAALIAARRLGLPFVYEVRGLWEITDVAKKGSQWLDSERFQLDKKLETLVAREADQVLVITEGLRDELRARGVAAEKIVVVPNCVDTDRFAPIPPSRRVREKLNLDPTLPTVGFAGSIVGYEGLDLLLAALAKVAAAGLRFNLLIVGDGPELEGLKSRAHALGIADRCRFPGRVPHAQITDYLSCMDIMPCPRRAELVTEMVSPLKPLEAMAMGKAVLLSDVAPHFDFAGREQERALLFRKDDVDDLADTLTRLIASPELRSSLGVRARLWVAQKRTWSHAGRILGEAYDAATRAANEATEQITGADTAKRLDEIDVALIADRFTTDALVPEIRAHPVTPDNWRDVLNRVPVDALFVESAWTGNDGAWHRKVGHYSTGESSELRSLIEWCRARGIPTLFWNKEDPVHFKRFQHTAALFDHVFTTDAGCIGPYLATPGTHAKTAASLPFFAQPAIHNPLPPKTGLQSTICFGGTYYGGRYADRSVLLDDLLRAARPYGLTIYDRQWRNPESSYRFPEEFADCVRGGLDYGEMLEAYKAHPVHLNVNSVQDSPTMFSRRVVEIVASGSAVISGAGTAVGQVLRGTVPVVGTREGAEGYLGLWMERESARRAAVWPGLREVMQAHTAGHRIAYALRTAGLRVSAPRLPRYAVYCTDLTAGIGRALRRQSVRPAVVVAGRADEEAAQQLGREILDASTVNREELERLGIEWIGRLSPARAANLDDRHFEDLISTSRYYRGEAIGSAPMTAGGAEAGNRGIVAVDRPVELDGGLIRTTAWFGGAGPQARVRPRGLVAFRETEVPALSAARPRVSERPTILFAGHDFKFITEVIDRFRRCGYPVLVDRWQGHRKQDVELSRSLIPRADVIFCEWFLGNAVWYARHKRSDQALVVRLHGQETGLPFLSEVDLSRVGRVIFVGPHVRDEVVRDHGWPRGKTALVANYANPTLGDREKVGNWRHAIGFVGTSPRKKRLDLALDLIGELRRRDPAFHLYVKGRRPEEYGWMRSRPEELVWYDEQYRRIADNELLAHGVTFDPYADDLPEWYAKIGFALSVSDFESFHLTIADGAETGAVPLILPWIGADRVYPPSWISPDLNAMADRAAGLAADREAFDRESAAVMAYVRERCSLDRIFAELESIVLEAWEARRGRRVAASLSRSA